MEEKPDLLGIAQRIEEFTNQGPENDVSNFVLEGPLQNDATITRVAAALFPPKAAGVDPYCAILTTDPNEKGKMAEYHSRILRLNINDRIQQLHVPDDPMTREIMTQLCNLNGWPVIAIMFARYKRSTDEVIVMHSIAGMSPQTALREFQNKSRERIAKLS